MGKPNQNSSSFNFLENSQSQDNSLRLPTHQEGLNLGLSLGGSRNSQTPKERGLMLRKASFNGDNSDISELAVNNYISGQQIGQRLLIKAVSRHLEVEEALGVQKELRERKIKEAVKIENKERRPGNGVVESVAKNTALCRALEKIKSIRAPGSSNVLMVSTPYHTMATSFKANEIRKPAYNQYGNYQNGNPAVGSSKRSNLDIMPAVEGNGVKRSKISVVSFNSGDISESQLPTIELINQMPSVNVVSPTGNTVEGVLFRFNEKEVVVACTCHCRSLTPAEFVCHAGWSDVANPYQHIKIQPLQL